MSRLPRWCAGWRTTRTSTCGTAALGRLWLEASDEPARATVEAVPTRRGADPLWRVREGTAMAGERIGAASPEGLAGLVGRWLATGHPLVARAAIAAVCEPAILTAPLLRSAARAHHPPTPSGTDTPRHAA